MKTIGPAFPGSYASADSWLDYVKGLRILPPTKASKLVPDVTLILSKKSIVRVNRKPKQLTEQEVAMLALEHGKEPSELTELLTKRKIIIVNELGVQTNAAPKRVRKTSQTNAGNKPRRSTRRSKNQLLQPGADSDVHAQGPLLPEPETAK